MKWYSVKKYAPITEDCLLRLQNKHNPDVFVYVVGRYSLTHKKWLFFGIENYQENYNITPTHFCMIPPVEIEE